MVLQAVGADSVVTSCLSKGFVSQQRERGGALPVDEVGEQLDREEDQHQDIRRIHGRSR